MELREIVCAHDPYEAHARDAAAQMRDRVDSVARADDSFETADIDTRVVGDGLGGPRAFGQRAQGVVFLERIAGTEQPPHAIELQPLDREQADGAMRRMRRIEGAAEQANAHAVAVERYRLCGRDSTWLQRDAPEAFTAASVRSRARGI